MKYMVLQDLFAGDDHTRLKKQVSDQGKSEIRVVLRTNKPGQRIERKFYKVARSATGRGFPLLRQKPF